MHQNCQRSCQSHRSATFRVRKDSIHESRRKTYTYHIYEGFLAINEQMLIYDEHHAGCNEDKDGLSLGQKMQLARCRRRKLSALKSTP